MEMVFYLFPGHRAIFPVLYRTYVKIIRNCARSIRIWISTCCTWKACICLQIVEKYPDNLAVRKCHDTHQRGIIFQTNVNGISHKSVGLRLRNFLTWFRKNVGNEIMFRRLSVSDLNENQVINRFRYGIFCQHPSVLVQLMHQIVFYVPRNVECN